MRLVSVDPVGFLGGHQTPKPIVSLSHYLVPRPFAGIGRSLTKIQSSKMASKVSPYLLRVNSRPTKVDEATWEKWYIEEHVPDLQNAKVSVRAAFYRSTHDLGGLSTATEIPADEKQFLALYQCEMAVPLETKEYLEGVPKTSEMLPGKQIGPCAEWDVRNYELIEERDPKGLGHGISLLFRCFRRVCWRTCSADK